MTYGFAVGKNKQENSHLMSIHALPVVDAEPSKVFRAGVGRRPDLDGDLLAAPDGHVVGSDVEIGVKLVQRQMDGAGAARPAAVFVALRSKNILKFIAYYKFYKILLDNTAGFT